MEGMDGGDGRQQEGRAQKEDAARGGMEGMNMGGGKTGSSGMAREMVEEDGRYSDRAFIDAMVPHHQGAVEMAEVALKNAEHEEIRQLAENIIRTQQTEIGQLKAIKQREFGTSEVPTGMGMKQMEDMGMMMDPQSLAGEDPFDRAFIDAMIPHHESVIEMADAALDGSENPEIREIAGVIVEAQEKEIDQMERWRKEWYPGS